MNIRYRHAGRAFTLIEILIAMAILGAIVTAIYASWTAILRGAKVGLDAAADVQRTRIAMRTVEEALSSAVMFSKNAYFYGFESDTSGDFAMLSFVSRLPDSFPGGGMFPGQPLRRVTFGVEPDAGGVNQLVMRQMPVFQVLEAGEQPYPIVLSRKVSQFGLEFWDSKLNDWTYEWVQTNQLPPLVRVSLRFGEAKNNLVRAEDLAIREIALASVAVAPEYQIGQAAGGGPGGGSGVGPGGGKVGGPGVGGFVPGAGGFAPGGGRTGQGGGPRIGPSLGLQPGQGGRPRR